MNYISSGLHVYFIVKNISGDFAAERIPQLTLSEFESLTSQYRKEGNIYTNLQQEVDGLDANGKTTYKIGADWLVVFESTSNESCAGVFRIA